MCVCGVGAGVWQPGRWSRIGHGTERRRRLSLIPAVPIGTVFFSEFFYWSSSMHGASHVCHTNFLLSTVRNQLYYISVGPDFFLKNIFIGLRKG